MWGVHHEFEHLLVWTMGVFDLVVHGTAMLTDECIPVAVIGMALAAAAGFSQLFSL